MLFVINNDLPQSRILKGIWEKLTRCPLSGLKQYHHPYRQFSLYEWAWGIVSHTDARESASIVQINLHLRRRQLFSSLTTLALITRSLSTQKFLQIHLFCGKMGVEVETVKPGDGLYSKHFVIFLHVLFSNA